MSEICKIKISKDTLQMLVDSSAITTDDFELVSVDESFDYSKDENWIELKKLSSKAYKKLKEHEYNLRNK